MWKYIAVQGLLFFLFFQPELVASRAVRVMLIVTALIGFVMAGLHPFIDPFVWLLYSFAVVLTYLMACETWKWIFGHRKKVREALLETEARAHALSQLILKKDEDILALQREIDETNNIYEKVKEMSQSLEPLDVFVDLSEALMDRFSLSKSRLILLKHVNQQLQIDRVYQLDKKYADFALDKNTESKETLFKGEIYPFDVRLVQLVRQDGLPRVYWSVRDATNETHIAFPKNMGSLIVIPVTDASGLAAILTLQGVDQKDYANIRILTDRFVTEFQRIKLYADVQQLAITDWLTGVYVRRYFFKRLEEEISRAKRFHLKFSFLMIDLDDFKKCNDQHGHLVGDSVLRQVADIIRHEVREVDLVGRYGGEEFAAILLDTDARGAMNVAERIRKGIEKKKFLVYDLKLRLTASVGFSVYDPETKSPQEIVEWADSALYQAKRQGKNRVCAYIPNSN